MKKREWALLVFLVFSIVVSLFYKYKQVVNSRGAVLKQECEDFSIVIFSKSGREILVQEFNPSYIFFLQDEKENTETVKETINQLGKMITVRFGNGVICCHAEKKVILKNFTRKEIIQQMVEFAAENQKKAGYKFSAGYELEDICGSVINNYNTGL